ncbi:MAG: AAA family ATPase [Pseudomonadota bacterium]
MIDDRRRIVLSGCSGGGKSTLLAALARRGFAVFEEPGRRIVREQRATGGQALPDVDPAAFLTLTAELARRDFEAAPPGPSFFDRSVVDAAAGFDAIESAKPASVAAAEAACRYDEAVFLAPPWPEIFEQDAERTHDFASAETEYDRLCEAYPKRGYKTIILPKVDIESRVKFVLAEIGLSNKKINF